MANQHVPFVQRLLNPGIYPVISPLWDNLGDLGTHKMSSGQMDDKYYAFPMIDYYNNQLTDFTAPPWNKRFGFDQAIKNKNYIEFNSPKEAEYFGTNYKEGLKLLENESGGNWWSRIMSGE